MIILSKCYLDLTFHVIFYYDRHDLFYINRHGHLLWYRTVKTLNLMKAYSMGLLCLYHSYWPDSVMLFNTLQVVKVHTEIISTAHHKWFTCACDVLSHYIKINNQSHFYDFRHTVCLSTVVIITVYMCFAHFWVRDKSLENLDWKAFF